MYCCLKEVLKPIILLNCIFCMGIFEIPKCRPRITLSVIYTVSILTGYFVLLYQAILIFQETSNRRLTIYYCVISVNVLVAICSIILFWHKSQNFAKLLKRFSLVDDTFEALGVRKNYGKLFRWLLFYTIIWITFMMLLNGMHAVWMMSEVGFWYNVYSTLCFGFPTMVNSVVDLTFGALIRCIKEKFQNANILINNAVQSTNKSGVFKIRSRKKCVSISFVNTNYKSNKDMIKHSVQTLKQLHLELTRISCHVNHTYCLQLLLQLAVHFTIITGVSYSLYTALFGHEPESLQIEKYVAMIVWELVYSMKIVMINNLCTSVSREACKTSEIVQTFDGCLLDDETRDEIRQFTVQIMLNSLDFTAAGFFKINNALTGAFFGTVATYVVILIQMKTGM